MKISVENKKGLDKEIKVFIDKNTITSHMNEKYEEVKKNVSLKGFRPGKVPREILKRQFGQAIFGEVLDKVLKDTTTKVLQEKKIKPAGQPKIDLKVYGEDKDLEYVILVTELPKIEIKDISSIKFDEYTVKIDAKETDKRIQEIAKSQKNFKEANPSTNAKEGDLVIFDYKATVEGKGFKGGEGKNTQLVIGKDLFIKGFDKKLIGTKKDDKKNIEVTLPENYPEKEFANKKAMFQCEIKNIKNPQPVTINDEFAKNLGAKDLNNLKELITKQINDEYKNSLNILTNKQILSQLEKIKVDQIPENLIEQEVKILTQGMKEEEFNTKKEHFENQAKKRIKTGLILNEFGEQNKIEVSEQELQNEMHKQLRMMPGQEKIIQEYYQKNPSMIANLKGSLYEEKIIQSIKSKAKANKKEITKEEAEKLLKAESDKHLNEHKHDHSPSLEKKAKPSKKTMATKKAKSISKKPTKTKKVSKK